MADDFCLDEETGVAYLTTHRQNTIDRVPLQPGSNGARQIVAGEPFDEQLVGPSSAAWGRRAGDYGRVAYITTDGGLIAPPTDDIVRPARLLRAELPRPGRSAVMSPPGIRPSPADRPPGAVGQPGEPADRAGRHSLNADTPRRHRVASIARGIAAIAIIAGSAAAIYAERGTLASGLDALWHARPGWVVTGVALECLSMAGFVLLQHRLLTAAGARSAVTWLLAADYASNAIASGVPIIGSGLAAAVSLRQFRRHGVDPAARRLTLGLAGVISTLTFAAVVATGAMLTGNPAGAATGLLAGCGSAAAATVLFVAARSPGGRARLAPAAARLLRLAQRITRRPAGDPDVIAARAIGRLGSLQLGPWSIGYVLACGLVNWTADQLCLAAAITAVGAAVPWDKLLLAWSAGAGASTLSPTPFGLGVVEVTLTAALTAAGISSPAAVGAVLLYRIMTFKIAGTLIWSLYPHLQPRQKD